VPDTAAEQLIKHLLDIFTLDINEYLKDMIWYQKGRVIAEPAFSGKI
jgi:hypothetical protein